jgi:hypothetical protein
MALYPGDLQESALLNITPIKTPYNFIILPVKINHLSRPAKLERKWLYWFHFFSCGKTLA